MDDFSHIRRALKLAARARGRTSPNPMVGALLVKAGRVIAEGYHRKAGTPHAEALAIDKAGDKAAGSTLYVSLEPCCHTDKRTPPCSAKIINSGIRRVVVSMLDPNPKVSGKGIAELRKAGITVECGLLGDEARRLNEAYCKRILTDLPFVTLKAAMTLDGKIATPEGESKWITGEKARKLVHRLRGESDAILTAIGTVRADDPRLTCRTGSRSPLRVVIDPELSIRADARVLDPPPETIVVARKSKCGARGKAAVLRSRGVRLLPFEGKRVDLRWLMKELAAMGVLSILVEAGGSLNASCLDAGIVDKVMIFIAPKIMGGKDSIPVVGGKNFRPLSDALRISHVKTRRIGEDILIEGYTAT